MEKPTAGPGPATRTSPVSPAASLGAEAEAGFTPRPVSGRLFATSRTVRATEVTPAGRLRLDAFARYLQDAAEDDVADTGWWAPYYWLLRRCSVAVLGYPQLWDRVTLQTFCTGTGPRWAERTTTLAGPDGDLMQATAVWVAIGRYGRPAGLGPDFHRLYGEAAGGRRVSARLTLPAPDRSAAGRSWQVRASDFDPAGHVNNAVHWEAGEDILTGLDWLPSVAELEYHQPILPGETPQLLASHAPERVAFWLVNGEGRLASGRLARTGGAAR